MHIGDVMLDRDGNIDAAKGAGYSNVNSIKEAVETLLVELEPEEGGVTITEIVNNQEAIQGVTLSKKKVEEQIEGLMKSGETYEPQTGEYVKT
jgi:DNA replicative helicase MCM subunit Mcm2 (Cdc46/Mcm family)